MGKKKKSKIGLPEMVIEVSAEELLAPRTDLDVLADSPPTSAVDDSILGRITAESEAEANPTAESEAEANPTAESEAEATSAAENVAEAEQAAAADVEAAIEAEASAEAASDDNADTEAIAAPELVAAVLPTEPKITDLAEIEQALEAVIFAAPKAISLQRLRTLMNSFNYDTSELSATLTSMMDTSAQRGIQLVKVANAFQYRTHPKQSDLLQKLLEDKPARLGQSALEVLAIVAYKQPLSRSEIDAVRGVDSGHLVKGLLEKNLVRSVGHAESPGRPLLYGTTPYFLEVFSLGSLDDLPAMDEFKRELAGGEGATLEGPDFSLMHADPGFFDRESPLAAEPDRGDFDKPAEERVDLPDFGLADRAAEDDEAQSDDAGDRAHVMTPEASA